MFSSRWAATRMILLCLSMEILVRGEQNVAIPAIQKLNRLIHTRSLTEHMARYNSAKKKIHCYSRVCTLSGHIQHLSPRWKGPWITCFTWGLWIITIFQVKSHLRWRKTSNSTQPRLGSLQNHYPLLCKCIKKLQPSLTHNWGYQTLQPLRESCNIHDKVNEKSWKLHLSFSIFKSYPRLKSSNFMHKKVIQIVRKISK